MLHKTNNDVLKPVAPLATDPWSLTDESGVHAKDSWMLSYIDVLTLLLTLLVLLLAYQKIQNQQIPSKSHTARADNRVTVKSVSKKQLGQLLVNDDPVNNSLSDEIPIVQEYPLATEIEDRIVVAEGGILINPQEEKQQLDRSSAIAKENTQPNPVETNQSATSHLETFRLSALLVETINNDLVEIVQEDQSVRIEFNESLLFSSGEADLKPEAGELLNKWIALLQLQDGAIYVEGHTDNLSIATQRYPSNWELSSSRAAAVTRYFIGRGINPERLQAVGYADTRPRNNNDTAEGRKRNRRVSIVIQTSGRGQF